MALPARNLAPNATVPLRVLVTDDDPVYRETARMFLSMYGRQVTLAADGRAALEAANSGEFDILIVDLEMPDMTGLEVIARIRQMPRHRDLPIVMVTSRDDSMAIDRAFELGASSFVVKPVNWTLLDHYLRFVRRAAENERTARLAQADAEALSRTKDNLLSIVRHEMKTPLNAIVGFTRLAAEARQSGDVAAMTEHLDQVTQSGNRLLACFADMTTYSDLLSGRQAFSPEPVRIGWILDDLFETAGRRVAAAGLAFEREGGEAESSKIRADSSLLTAALLRLVDNALQHAREATRIRFGVRIEGEWAHIAVEDDGEGMASDAIAACLEPFSQRDMSFARVNQGLGLGLPIAREVARRHGGDLAMESAPGNGTRVSFTLPLLAE